MHIIISKNDLHDLNDLVRDIMCDAVENYSDSPIAVDELSSADGAFTSWTEEILSLLQIEVEK